MFGPYEIPGRLEAENFDCGNAYYDSTETNEGKAFRNTPVDIEITGDTGGGHNVGWTRTGEWLKYKLNVKQSGVYNISSRVASALATGKFILRIDGQTITPTLSVPNTGAWQRYTNVTTSGISLNAGLRTLELYIAETGGNYNYFDFNLQSNTQPTVSISPSLSPQPTITSTPLTAVINIRNEWNTGYCAQVTVTNNSNSPVSGWLVQFNRNQSTITNSYWGIINNRPDGTTSITAKSGIQNIYSRGQSNALEYCASKSGSNWRPTNISALTL
jgi:hypothetical protein